MTEPMTDLPNWVYDMVMTLQTWRDEHPKLYADMYSTEAGKYVMQPLGEDGGCTALALVPSEVRDRARALAMYLERADTGAKAASSESQPGESGKPDRPVTTEET